MTDKRGILRSPSAVVVAFAVLALTAGGVALAYKVWQIDSRLKRIEQSDDIRAAATDIERGSVAERVDFAGNTFDTCVVDITRAPVKLYFRDSKGDKIRSLQKLKDYVESESGNLLFATNAGMYTAEGNPLGLLIQDGKQISPINLKDGTDNFYLKPNGVFAITRHSAFIAESSQFQSQAKAALASPDPVLFATQSGPLLVIGGKIHPAFQPNSANKCIRSGVGVVSLTKVVFAISDRPVNFYDFASLFRDRFNCNDALFLDGVISRMYLPALKRYDSGGDFAGLIGIKE